MEENSEPAAEVKEALDALELELAKTGELKESKDREVKLKQCCDCKQWSKCVYGARCPCAASGKNCTNCPSKRCSRPAGDQKNGVEAKAEKGVSVNEIADFEMEELKADSEDESADSMLRRQVLQLQKRVEALEKDRAAKNKELLAKDDLITSLARNLEAEAKTSRDLEARLQTMEEHLKVNNQLLREVMQRLEKGHSGLQISEEESERKEGPSRKRVREEDQASPSPPPQPRHLDSGLDYKHGPHHPEQERKALSMENKAVKQPVPKKLNGKDRENERENRRKKTLILKGLSKQEPSAVQDFLGKYDFAQSKDVQKVEFRQVNSQNWAFISFFSEDTVENIMRSKRKKLNKTSFYIQRDLNKETRAKERDNRLARKSQPLPQQLANVHEQRRSQIQMPPTTGSAQQGSSIINQQRQIPTTATANGHPNMTYFPNVRLAGAPQLTAVAPQQISHVRPLQYPMSNVLPYPLQLYNSSMGLYPGALAHPQNLNWGC